MNFCLQMSFEEDSNQPPSDLLSPDSMRRRRHQQFTNKPGPAGSNAVKFENVECPNKKVRFRKRAKSLVIGGLNSSSEQVILCFRIVVFFIFSRNIFIVSCVSENKILLMTEFVNQHFHFLK